MDNNDIKHFICPEQRNDLEAQEFKFESPQWLDTNHPKFPKHFTLAIYDKYGALVWWYERFPKQP